MEGKFLCSHICCKIDHMFLKFCLCIFRQFEFRSQNLVEMNKQHIPIPIEGFDRRPRKPQPYILSEVIEISDEESNGEPSVRRPKNLDFVKREPAGNDTTDSEISVPIDVINAKKKNKKKKEKRVMKKLVKKILKEKKKLKKELKKELNTSEETSNSDSDGSYDDSKRHVQHRFLASHI